MIKRLARDRRIVCGKSFKLPFERILSNGCLRNDDGNFISLDYIFKILKRIIIRSLIELIFF